MVLVDADVLLDILTADPRWRSWSEEKLLAVIETDQAAVSPIIYAGLGAAYRTSAELDRARGLAGSADGVGVRGGIPGNAADILEELRVHLRPFAVTIDLAFLLGAFV